MFSPLRSLLHKLFLSSARKRRPQYAKPWLEILGNGASLPLAPRSHSVKPWMEYLEERIVPDGATYYFIPRAGVGDGQSWTDGQNWQGTDGLYGIVPSFN
jgi:hypothetical protein